MNIDLSSIPWALIAPLLIIQGILMLVALIDLYRVPETKGPKWMWLLLILVSGLFASIVYFIVGRNKQ